MKDLVIFAGTVKLGKCAVIKKPDNFENFKDVLCVFRNDPYNEILTDEDCKREYDLYSSNGYIFGCYLDGKIAGINCILNDVPDDYSIRFEDADKVAYYSGLAVKDGYRGLGIGKLLVSKTQKYLEESGKYDYAFARILCEGSMSEGIFKLYGFSDAYFDHELITDDVSYMRCDGMIRADKRKYMVKRMSDNNSFFRR